MIESIVSRLWESEVFNRWRGSVRRSREPDLVAWHRSPRLSGWAVANLQRAYPALNSAKYRQLLTAQLFVEAGLTIFEVSLFWVAVQSSGGSLVGLIYGLIVLPGSVMAAMIGMLTDRFGSRPLLIAASLVGTSALWMASALSSVGNFSRPLMLLIAVATGVCLGLWSVPSQVLVGRVVDPEHAASAIGLSLLPSGLGALLGGSVGGVLLRIYGAWQAMLVAGVILLGAGVLVSRVPNVVQAGAVERLQRPMQTLKWMRTQPVVPSLVILGVVVSVFLVGRVVLFPVLVKNVIHGGSAELGLLIAAAGVGSLIGSFITDRLGNILGRGPTIVLGLISGAACLAFLGFSSLLAVSMILAAACSALLIVYQGTSAILIQLSADPRDRGRVVGAFDLTRLGLIPLGTVMLGWLADFVGVTGACVVAGLGTALVVLLASAFNPRLRRLHNVSAIVPPRIGL